MVKMQCIRAGTNQLIRFILQWHRNQMHFARHLKNMFPLLCVGYIAQYVHVDRIAIFPGERGKNHSLTGNYSHAPQLHVSKCCLPGTHTEDVSEFAVREHPRKLTTSWPFHV